MFRFLGLGFSLGVVFFSLVSRFCFAFCSWLVVFLVFCLISSRFCVGCLRVGAVAQRLALGSGGVARRWPSKC